MKPISLLFAVVIIFNCFVYAEGLKEPTPVSKQSLGIPEYLMHTAAGYNNGVLQIEIPFWGNPVVQQIGIGLTGLQMGNGVKPGNSLGWITYVDDEGDVLFSGPIRSLNGWEWLWYYDFMPSRVEIAGTHLPMWRPGSPGAT